MNHPDLKIVCWMCFIAAVLIWGGWQTVGMAHRSSISMEMYRSSIE